MKEPVKDILPSEIPVVYSFPLSELVSFVHAHMRSKLDKGLNSVLANISSGGERSQFKRTWETNYHNYVELFRNWIPVAVKEGVAEVSGKYKRTFSFDEREKLGVCYMSKSGTNKESAPINLSQQYYAELREAVIGRLYRFYACGSLANKPKLLSNVNSILQKIPESLEDLVSKLDQSKVRILGKEGTIAKEAVKEDPLTLLGMLHFAHVTKGVEVTRGALVYLYKALDDVNGLDIAATTLRSEGKECDSRAVRDFKTVKALIQDRLGKDKVIEFPSQEELQAHQSSNLDAVIAMSKEIYKGNARNGKPVTARG